MRKKREEKNKNGNEQTQTNARTQATVPKEAPVHSSEQGLSSEDISSIRELRQEGSTYKEIADELGISKSTAHKYSKNVKPSETTNSNRGSEESNVFPSTNPNKGQVSLADADALERIRLLMGKPKSQIVASYEQLLRQAVQKGSLSPYENLGSSPLQNTLPSILASQLAGARDASYLRALGLEPRDLFGLDRNKRNNGSSDTSGMLKEMRDYALTMGLLEKIGVSKEDPLMLSLKTEMKSLSDKYEKLRDNQHESEIKNLEQKIEEVRHEKNEVEKVKELLKDSDPALQAYVRQKLGLKKEESIIDSLQKLGINAKEVWGWVQEFMGRVRAPTQMQPPPTPPGFPVTSAPTESPDEQQIAKRALGFDQQGPPTESDLPPETEKRGKKREPESWRHGTFE